jgi:hypothetical protein
MMNVVTNSQILTVDIGRNATINFLKRIISSLSEVHGPNVTSHYNAMLYEIYQATVPMHHAKMGYDYPVTRLPHTFSILGGLSARIYQTIRDGMLAFLVVTLELGDER